MARPRRNGDWSTGTPPRREEIEAFGGRLRGRLIGPDDREYDEARAVWNGMIDRRPALIARCADVADVVEAVGFARARGLLVAVRGGGHNVAGLATCDGGLVIDLSPMRAVQVDPAARVARAQGGARWAEVDSATQPFGLATPGGVVSDTGIAGLTLGGGFGWLSGKHGLSCDNLLAAEVVTADGRVLRASETENPDLFWGIRGGGGNFGVVTTFEYRLHPVEPAMAFLAAFHDCGTLEETKDALRFFRKYVEAAPDEASAIASCGVIPPGHEGFPESIHGRRFVLFIGLYVGPPDEGERALRPLRDYREPLADLSRRVRYAEAQTFFDAEYPARELRYYWKALNLTGLTDEAIAGIAERAIRQPSPLTTTDVWHLGRGVRSVPEDACAFSGRHVEYMLNVEANWQDPKDDEANVGWARQFIEDMRGHSDGGRYMNFPGFLEAHERTMRATFGAKYDRLVALKERYDPTNLFRLNQNVKPPARQARPAA